MTWARLSAPILALVGLGCGTASRVARDPAPIPPAAKTMGDCPATPAGLGLSWGRVFIDGRRTGGDLKVRQDRSDPPSYEIVDPEPEELARLPVDRIDLIEYASGPDAEAQHELCGGMIAILVTTK